MKAFVLLAALNLLLAVSEAFTGQAFESAVLVIAAGLFGLAGDCDRRARMAGSVGFLVAGSALDLLTGVGLL